MKTIEQFIGKIETTKDASFGELVEVLDERGLVVQEREFFHGETKEKWFDLVTTVYRVDGKYYELWYQVPTPYMPTGVLCSYGLHEIDPVE